MTQLITYEGKTYSFTDDFTDEEISETLSSLPAEPEPEPEPEPTPVAPEPAEGLLDRTGELLEAGARQFAGSSASGLSSALEYFDAAPETQDQLDAFAAEQEAAGQQVAPIKALQEAEGVGDVVSSAYEYLAQSAPHMGAMITGAWAGGKAAAALTSFVPPVGWGIPVRAVAIFGGGLLGGATATFNSFFGNNVQEAQRVKGREKLTATELEGAAYAAFGQSVADAIISKLLPHKGSPGMLRNTIKKFLQGSLIEGTTEVFQDALEILQANDWNLDALTTPEAKYRLTESALAGAAIGGPLSGATGPFTALPRPPVDPFEGERPTEEPPLPEEEVTETEEVLALPAPVYTPTGDDAGGTVEGDPVEFVQNIAEQWPSDEALPNEFNIAEDSQGFRIVTPDDRVLTPYFKERAQAEQALIALNQVMPEIREQQAEKIIEHEAQVALEETRQAENAALIKVAQELVRPVTDFSEEEVSEAFNGDEVRISKVMAELEALPNGLREEITWEDIVKINNDKPKIVTPADLDALLLIKKPETSKGIITPQDILTIAKEQNISADPKRKRIRVGNQKKKKDVLTATEKSFKLYAKRLTGRQEIHAMSQTQLQVLADGLAGINKGQPFEKETRVPIAERPRYTESQIQKAAQALRTDETFVEKKGKLKGASKNKILQSISDSTEVLDATDREAVFTELVRRGTIKKDKGNNYRLPLRVKTQRLTFDEGAADPRRSPRDNRYATGAEELAPHPEKVQLAQEIEDGLRARLKRRGLDNVDLQFVTTVPTPSGAPDISSNQVIRGKYQRKSNGTHLIMLALDAIPLEVRKDARKLQERLAATMDHESIHALVEEGVITPKDMDSLKSAVETELAWDWNTGVRSDQTYVEQAEKLYANVRLKGQKMSPLEIREEAIANLFRDYTLNKTDLSPRVKTIWQKIVGFFRDVAISAREKGINDARELFQKIEQRGPQEAAPTVSSQTRADHDPNAGMSDSEMGGVKLEVAERGTVPAIISTNVQLASITDYFNRNMRKLQQLGVNPNKWKLDRIIPDGERVAVRTDYRVKAPLNEGVLDNAPPEISPMTGETFAMQGVHLLYKKSGNPNFRSVAGYDTSVTLDNVEFRVDQDARNDLLKGAPTDVPPALTHGNIVKGQDSTDGVPIVFNPFRQHLFVREDNGMAVKGADQVTLINGRAYARGNIEYWNQAEAPATNLESQVLYQDGSEEYARPSLDLEGPDYDVSSLSTFYNPSFPAEPPGSRNIWQIITRLADRALAAWGRPLAELDQANMETVARIMAAEAREALKKSGNAADWYAEDINKMVDLLALNGGPYPELKTDGNARAAFAIALSITSINTQVEANMNNALMVYDAYKQTVGNKNTGQFPENMGWGVAASGMRKKFRQMNQIIDELGLDGMVQFMNTPFTKAELVKLGFPGAALGGVTPGARVYGSYLLGPKLGSFFQNLTGNFDTITMDKWFMRTWNRITGQFPTETDILTAAQSLINGRARRSANRLGINLTGAEASPEATIEAATRLANALDREWQVRKKAGAKAKEKLGITTQAQAFQDILSGDEVPGAQKRQFMDQTVRRSLEILGDYNINVPPASFQAIIWYPEQDLFRKMGMKPEGRERSYGAAAAKAMKGKGYGGQVDATLRAIQRRGAQPAGRNVGNSALSGTAQLQRDALEGRDRTRFIRYHTAKAFRESFGPRFGTEEPPTPFKRKSTGTVKFVLADGTTLKVPSEATYTPKKKASNYLVPAGVSMPKFVELKFGDPEAVSFFYDRIMNAQASTEFADAVTVYPQDVYKHKRLFVTLDGAAGFALDEGNIQSVFKDKAAPYQQVSFSQLVLAIDQGGRTLDAFDTVLPELYSFVGFEAVSRLPFNEEVAASDGIDIEAFKRVFAKFRDGKPDLVFMAFNPNNFELYSPPPPAVRDAEMAPDYDAAVEAQEIAVSEIRTGINDGLGMTEALYELGEVGSPRRDNEAFWKQYKATYPNDDRHPNMLMHPGGDPKQSWGSLLWRDLDHPEKYLEVPVDVRLGYHMPTRDPAPGQRETNGYGMRHAKEHDADFLKFTDFANTEEALLSFLEEFKTQTASAGIVNLGTREPYVKKMMTGESGLPWVGTEKGKPGARNRPMLFQWFRPGLTVPIKFMFTAYRNTQTGKMTFSLLTAYPVTDRVEKTERIRQVRDGKAYHPEKLTTAGREGAAIAEEMTPKAQQALVNKVVQKGGTLKMPQPKVEPEGRYEVAETVAPARNALLEFIKANPDGFTVDLDGETVPPSGYAFAPIKGAEIVIKPEDLTLEVVDQLIDYVERVQEITGGDVYAGGWLDSESGNYFLDASMVFDDKAEALYAASAADQIAVFNLGTFDEIRTATGIEGLKQTGVYSPEAHTDARTKARTLSSRFAEERPDGTAQPEERYEVAEVTTAPAFKEWFGDSNVVDADGNPLVVYHSTVSDFDSFKQIGHFGTSQAANDRLLSADRQVDGSTLLPVYLSIQNPLDVGREENDYGGVWENDNEMFRRVAEVLNSRGERELAAQIEEMVDRGPADADLVPGATPTSHKNVTKMLMEAGYDGIVYENAIEDAGSTSYVTFDPTQVKSALNRGTFDPATADIRYEVGDYNPIEATTPSYDQWRGRGMSLTLDQQPDRATLTIESAGEKVEVRGHPGVGAVYEGSSLDRVINAIPKRADLSALFAGETRNLPPEATDAIIDALELEEAIAERMQASLEPVEPEPTPADPTIPHRYRRGARYEAAEQPTSREQDRVTENTGGRRTEETFGDKILRVTQMFGTRPVARDDPKSFPHFGQWFRTNVFDRFDPIRRGEIRAWKKLGKDLRDITADVGAWAAFRMLKRSIGIFQTALTRGVPVYRNGMFTSEVISPDATRPDGRPLTLNGEPVAGTEFGLLQIFEQLVQNKRTGRRDTMREFQSYAVARRAARLIQEGRQRMMTTEDIITQLAMADTIPQIVARFNSPDITPEYVRRVLDKTVSPEQRAWFGDGRAVDFQEIFDAYQVWNSGQVQMMVEAGVISQEMAQTWVDTADYIPYYRQMADKNNYGQLDDMFKIYNNIRPPEKLVGEQDVWTIDITVGDSTIQAPQVFNTEEEAKVYAGKLMTENGDRATIGAPRKTIAPMLDLLETVSQNSLAAIQTSMANVAMQRAVRNLVLIDEASVAPAGQADGVVRFRVNGEEKVYYIHDPAMYTSLTVLDDRQGPLLKLFGMPANLLRNFVTRTPEFMMSNMLRDTLSAWAVSGKKGVPVVNTAAGFVQALAGSTSGKAISAAGVWAGHDFQDDPTDAATAMRDLYVRRQRFGGRGGENWFNPMMAIYNKLGKWSAASDAATRIKVYEQVLKETGNEAQAVFEAVEVLNFGAKGASPIIKVATATIPFLNARLQGLDLFYRASGIGAEGFTADPQSNRVKRRFWARLSTLAALSAMYWMLVHDDEDWMAQEAHTKDNYWIIPLSWIPGYDGPPIKIPIPFEVGLISKVIPERLMGYVWGQETNRDMLASFKRGVQSTLEINPYPQAILPLVEASTNHSYFTGRAIEPKSMESLEPGWRYNQHTSQLAISMGRALNDAKHVLPEEFISPMRIDHMMRGYTGTLGTYILDVVDWGWRNLGDNAERPTRSAYEYPVMRRFFAKEAGRGIVTQAYELMDEVKSTLDTLKRLEETPGLEGEALDFARERQSLLDVAEDLKPIKKELKTLRQERQSIFEDPLMSADEKRRAVEIIAALEQQAVQDIPALRRWAFD